MPVSAVQTISRAQNGVGAFLLQCKRLDFHYCDHGGSSAGMRDFLRHKLPQFAHLSPSIEISVSPRPNHHPVIRAHYINAPTRAICVKNLDKLAVEGKAGLLKEASGEKNRRIKGGRNVRSQNESVRGVWSGLHGEMLRRFDGGRGTEGAREVIEAREASASS